ncbi:glutamyl-tRNA amidotransferase [Actinomyces sp. 594]|uniref:GAD-like domain-containing protein n=1 Tax=Actinomyces sp. 594 TaxID=2057793 RepID=UPI001C59668F|nr:GAD-like domain-containing protein [Actinomyces sp. 594]MBW3067996.1 glutamyl-tRNA amidotransferase [Actinomyces sp. 594]
MEMDKAAWHEAWLHATPQWVDAMMDDELEYNGWSPMGAGRPASREHLERFKDVLPASVLQLWRRFGFDGFGDGRWWFTDPLQWQPVVDAWLENTPTPFPEQKWWCLSRTAMGDMELWGEVSGPALTITPTLGWIRPDAGQAQGMADPVMRERMGCLTLTMAQKDTFEDHDTGQLLVDWAIEHLGLLGPGQVYGLTPAYCFTGRASTSQMGIEDATAHLTFLAQAQEHQLVEDFSDAVSGIASGIANTTDNGGDSADDQDGDAGTSEADS